MDQITEMLNGLTEDEIAKYATNSSSEEHIVIGADRKITVPSSLKRLAVQFDHNVETVTFDAPRYWDGIDMATSEFVTYINYLLPDHTPGAYVAKNVRVDETDDSVMHFDWTIESNITQTQGTIVFLVCHKKLGKVEVKYEQTVYDEDGNPVLDENGVEQTETVTEMRDTLVNHWNSEPCKECYISEGMECDEAVLEMYPDVLTQVLLAINRFEGMEVTQFVQRLEGIENDISENDSAIQVLEEKVAELEGDVANKAEIRALEARIAAVELDIAILKDEDEHILEQLSDLQAQISALEDRITPLFKLSAPTLSYNKDNKILTISGDNRTKQYWLYGIPDEGRITLIATNGVATYNCIRDYEYHATVYAIAAADGFTNSDQSASLDFDYGIDY